MTFSIHGLAVARGIAIGRAVLTASSRTEVRHYFIEPEQIEEELARVRRARDAVAQELQRLADELPPDAPPELSALLDVHLLLLQDELFISGTHQWIVERRYNAEWALVTQLEQVARQFDEMDDPYLRERKADLEQVVDRILRYMRGNTATQTPAAEAQCSLLDGSQAGDALVLVAQDLSPADMLQFKRSVFAGFVTSAGGKTSHTAIVARSMDIPAVVGTRVAHQLIRQDDWLIVDGDAGVVLVDPSPAMLEEYRLRQRQIALERERLERLRHAPALTLDGQPVELQANIEQPADAASAVKAGASGVGLFRSEFLFMGRDGQLPDEQEQYLAYRAAVEGMQGLPLTIRTIDIGADKPLERHGRDLILNPALGLRAIRWSLAEPAMFRAQLRAVLRAAQHGPVRLMFPMMAHRHEITQTLALVEQARQELQQRGEAFGPVQLGAMIEVPAAALMIDVFLQHFDFVSLGTNDLIQYTLAIDRADEEVAHLYDPLHPAVLRLIAQVIAAANARGKSVSVCGEMAGDPGMTRLLLGLGLRSFSMHPAQLLAVKQEVLRANASKLAPWAQEVLAAEDPQALLQQNS
jgi:phosphotransferase system enzyme I (PtsI)